MAVSAANPIMKGNFLIALAPCEINSCRIGAMIGGGTGPAKNLRSQFPPAG